MIISLCYFVNHMMKNPIILGTATPKLYFVKPAHYSKKIFCQPCLYSVLVSCVYCLLFCRYVPVYSSLILKAFTLTVKIKHSSYNTFLPHLLSSQTRACQTVPLKPPAEKAMPRMAVLMWALGIGMCGYSSRQVALHHRPSACVLQRAGPHTDVVGAGAQRAPFLDLSRHASACQGVPPPSFVGQKVSLT